MLFRSRWCGNPFPFSEFDNVPINKRSSDCHVAALLAMTVVDGMRMLKLITLAQMGRQSPDNAKTAAYAAVFATRKEERKNEKDGR